VCVYESTAKKQITPEQSNSPLYTQTKNHEEPQRSKPKEEEEEKIEEEEKEEEEEAAAGAPLCQGNGLGHHVDATDHRDTAQSDRRAQRFKLLRDLNSQFAGDVTDGNERQREREKASEKKTNKKTVSSASPSCSDTLRFVSLQNSNRQRASTRGAPLSPPTITITNTNTISITTSIKISPSIPGGCQHEGIERLWVVEQRLNDWQGERPGLPRPSLS
jgi:hypothetical protein